jgi:hypothetical protein
VDELVCGISPTSRKAAEESAAYPARDSALAACDARKRALLQRYSGLSAKRSIAVLELMWPD